MVEISNIQCIQWVIYNELKCTMNCFLLLGLTQRWHMQVFLLVGRLGFLAYDQRHSPVVTWVGRELLWCQGPLGWLEDNQLTGDMTWNIKRQHPSLSVWLWGYRSLVLTWFSLRLSHDGFSNCKDVLGSEKKDFLLKKILKICCPPAPCLAIYISQDPWRKWSVQWAGNFEDF